MSTRTLLAAVLAAIAGLGLVAPRPAAAQAVPPAPAVLKDLAPTGKLRAAINYGNPVLAQRDPASSDLRGVSVDLARELARRLGVDVTLVPFDAAGKVFEAAKGGAWDVGFLAVDPVRAADIAFTASLCPHRGDLHGPAGLAPEDHRGRRSRGRPDRRRPGQRLR